MSYIGYRYNSHHNHRLLSFVDEDDEYSDLPNNTVSELGLIIGFAILAGGFCIVAIMSIRVTSTCREFYEWNAIRLILPAIQWAMAIECATLSYDSKYDTTIQDYWAIAVYMLQATVAPGIFLSTFVMTFLAYRTRSIPFCMVYRGKGRTAENPHGGVINSDGNNGVGSGGGGSGGGGNGGGDDDEAMQPLVRPATMVVMIRLFALGIFMLTLVVNFDVVWNEQDLAGRTGWSTIITEPWDDATIHIFLSLLPMALTSLSCLYFTILLYRYGTYFSMVIYSNIFNPWISPVVGTGFLITGQCFGPDLFPILSNAGILLYHICFLRGMYEVRYDMRQARDLGHFLNALGDEVVTGSVPVEATNTNDLDSSGYHFGGGSSTKETPFSPPPPSSAIHNPHSSYVQQHHHQSSHPHPVAGNPGVGYEYGDPEEVPPLPSMQ